MGTAGIGVIRPGNADHAIVLIDLALQLQRIRGPGQPLRPGKLQFFLCRLQENIQAASVQPVCKPRVESFRRRQGLFLLVGLRFIDDLTVRAADFQFRHFKLIDQKFRAILRLNRIRTGLCLYGIAHRLLRLKFIRPL